MWWDRQQKRPGATRDIGLRGEKLAAQYLKKRGYTLLERNYRERCGEIDLIARQGDCLVFIEVKTRTSRRFGDPAEAVDVRKQRQLGRLALSYLGRHNLLDTFVRFDVVSVDLERTDDPVIELYQNAFELTDD
ncbi:MAG: YraN family protein [Desulfobulbus propionicus]|nr:MAG: YraN family protein [Desulfobulbus propionicus]